MGYEKILVGTDGSSGSQAAVAEAMEIARGAGAEVIIVTAYTRPDQSVIESLWDAARDKTGAPEEIQWRLTAGAAAQTAVDQALAVASAATIPSEGRVVEGEAAAVILDTAADVGADLIVLGSRGMASTARFLLGSVPDKVSHHAPCDLLIVYGA